MRNSRRVIIWILVVIMMALSIGACSNSTDGNKGATGSERESTPGSESPGESSNENSDSVQITIWHEESEEIAAAIQREMDKLAPEIVVNVERKEQMSDALKLVGNDASSAPDMYFYAHDKVGTFGAMGILDPITKYLTEDDLADLLPMTLQAGVYREEMYQLPLYYEVQMFLYNKALMSDSDVPATTDDLLVYMKENTTDDTYAYVEQHTNAYTVSSWIHAYGAEIINSKTEPGLDSQEMMDALTYHKEFVGYMPSDGEYNTVTTLFIEGKAHSIVSGPWLVPEITAAGIDLGIAAMPIVNETGKRLAPYSGVQGVCVLKVAESKGEAVTRVLQQLAGTDLGIELANIASCAPANELCYEDDSVKENTMISAMLEAADYAVPMPNIPEMSVMWSISESMLASINRNNEDVKKTCENAQKEALSQIEAMQ